MEHTYDFQVGDRVRLICDLPGAPAGTEGEIREVIRDRQQQITALRLFVSDDINRTFGTSVMPREVVVVRRAADAEAGAG